MNLPKIGREFINSSTYILLEFLGMDSQADRSRTQQESKQRSQESALGLILNRVVPFLLIRQKGYH